MNIQTLAFIIVGLFAVALFIGLFIAIFLYGRATVKDKPKECAVMVRTGSHIVGFKGKLSESTKDGDSFIYNRGKIIMIPRKYKEVYYKQMRLVFIDHMGQLIPNPFDKDIKASESEKESLIYELVASHIGADGMRALKGKTQVGIILIAIIAFIIGCGVMFAFNQFRSANVAPQQPPAQTQPAPTNEDSGKVIIVEP